MHKCVCRLNYIFNYTILYIPCEASSVQRIFRAVSLIRQEPVWLFMRNKSTSDTTSLLARFMKLHVLFWYSLINRQLGRTRNRRFFIFWYQLPQWSILDPFIQSPTITCRNALDDKKIAHAMDCLYTTLENCGTTFSGPFIHSSRKQLITLSTPRDLP